MRSKRTAGARPTVQPKKKTPATPFESVISTDGSAAKIAALAIQLLGADEAERIVRARQAQAKAAGDKRMAEAWRHVAAEIARRKPN